MSRAVSMAGSMRGSTKGSWDLGDLPGVQNGDLEDNDDPRHDNLADLGSPSDGGGGQPPLEGGRPDSRDSDRVLRGAASKLEGVLGRRLKSVIDSLRVLWVSHLTGTQSTN